jgi:heme/copper-type cytochrome/quinol oxidase subunit 2
MRENLPWWSKAILGLLVAATIAAEIWTGVLGDYPHSAAESEQRAMISVILMVVTAIYGLVLWMFANRYGSAKERRTGVQE